MQLVAVINSKLSIALILLSLFTFTACEEQVEKGDSLSEEARNRLRQRAALKCINGSEGTIEDFYEKSNNNMLDFEHEDTWEYKQSKGDTEIEKSHIYVWKVDPPNVYFRIRLDDDGDITNQFVKIDTTINQEMIQNLQREKCNKELEMNFSSSKMTANIEGPRINEDSETESETEIDYRIESQYPAYFGVLNRKSTKRFYDKDDDDTVKDTETRDFTIKRIADVDQPATYDDGTITNREYCVVAFSAPPSGSTLNTVAFPFVLNCVDSDTNGPDANGDGTEDFDPATELIL